MISDGEAVLPNLVRAATRQPVRAHRTIAMLRNGLGRLAEWFGAAECANYFRHAASRRRNMVAMMLAKNLDLHHLPGLAISPSPTNAHLIVDFDCRCCKGHKAVISCTTDT